MQGQTDVVLRPVCTASYLSLTATDQSAYLSGITQELKGERTEYRAASRDRTTPTVTVKPGEVLFTLTG